MICRSLQGKDSIIYEILILKEFLTFQEDQLGKKNYFARIFYAVTILIIQGNKRRL